MEINLDVDPTKVGPYYKGAQHDGYKYPKAICDWFSTAIDRPVIFLHSPMTRRMDLNPKRHIHKRDGDLRKTYTSDCAFHMVNQSSVVDLRRRVKESHPEGLENFYVDFE